MERCGDEKAAKLAAEWLDVNSAVQSAIEKRMAIEQQIIDMFKDSREGLIVKKLAVGLEIHLKNKVKFKADMELLKAITSSWDVRPIVPHLEIDEATLRAWRSQRAPQWDAVASAIRVIPVQPEVHVEVVG